MLPLVFISLSFLAGAGMGLGLPPVPPWPWAALALLGAAGFLHPRLPSRAQGRWALIFLISCGLGALRGRQALGEFQGRQALFPEARSGVFLVRLVEEPEVLFKRAPGGHETGREGGFYAPQVERIRSVVELFPWEGNPGRLVRARCTFLLSPNHPSPVLSYGDWVEVRGRISQPRAPMNPGQFDYPRFLRSRNIPFVLYAAPGRWERQERMGQGGGGFKGFCLSLKRATQDVIARRLPYPENALLEGLLLGEGSNLTEEILGDFSVTGTVHVLAVSGMNTALVAGLLYLFFRVLRLKRKAAALLALGGLACFVFMTGAPASVCRAGLMGALGLTALLFERAVHWGTLVSAAAAFLVLLNPFALTDLSFQLSFLATLGLLVFTPWSMEKLSFLWKPAALALSATLSAQLAVWPLLLYHFNLFALYALPANLAVAPLVSFATAAGFTLVGFSPLAPASELFAAAAWVPLKLLILTAHSIARWPAASQVLASPPPWWMVLFHVLLAATFRLYWPAPNPENPSPLWREAGSIRARGRRALGLTWMLFTALSLCCATLGFFREKPLRICFLSVGHGDAVVIRSPGGETLVVDGGRLTEGPARFNPVVGYLRHEGVRELGAVLNTHPDADHVGGLAKVVEAYRPLAAYQGSGAGAGSRAYAEFLGRLREKNTRLVPLRRGDTLPGFGGLSLRILHPSGGFKTRRRKDNNRSVVTSLSLGTGLGEFRLLLPGDLEREGWEGLLRGSPISPGLDVLMAAHHGRASGEPALSARALRPRRVVFSDAKDHPDSREAFIQEGAAGEVYSTARDGAVEMEVYRDGTFRCRTFREGVWRTEAGRKGPLASDGVGKNGWGIRLGMGV